MFLLNYTPCFCTGDGIECYTCRPDVSKKMYCTRPQDLYMKWCPESNQCVLHRYFDEPYCKPSLLEVIILLLGHVSRDTVAVIE